MNLNVLKLISVGIRGLYYVNIKRKPDSFFPPLLSLKITDRCNQYCITCKHHIFGDQSKEIQREKWLELLEDFKKGGGLSVRFTGGEPFIRKNDMFLLIERSKSLGLRVAIATNGSLITDEDISLLKHHSIDHITISMQGIGKIHDKIVNHNGNWDILHDGIKKMTTINLPVDIAFTIIKDNLDQITNIIQYAKTMGIAVGFNIFDTNLYFLKDVDTSLAPDLIEMVKCSHQLVELKKKYPRHINGSIRIFKEIPNLIKESRLPHYYCARALLELFMDSFGNVYTGCWAMPPIGNVMEADLLTLIKSEKYSNQRNNCFLKNCSGCTCGYEFDVLLNITKRRER